MTPRFPARDRADVYRGDALAGTLERIANGAVFHYDEAYLARGGAAIAVRLPTSVVSHVTVGATVPPFFANLLPEGVRLDALLRGVKSAKDDLLSMLVVVGGDTVGDVAVVAPGTKPAEPSAVVDLDRTATLSFADLFAESIRYLPSGHYERSAVPGVQAKLSARHMTMSLRTRKRGAHILKLSATEYPRLVENEHFFMKAAKHAGIDAASCDVVTDGAGATALLVDRFDRVPGGSKVHQEDACQLLDRWPADKYLVSLREIADALHDVCDAPMIAVSGLLRLHAFSYLIGNGDLHAKNVSVHRPTGAFRLTPAYDLLSTLPYGDRHMALKLDGRDKNLRRRGFMEFGRRVGLRDPVVVAILDEVCAAAAPILKDLEAIGFEAKATRLLRKEIASRRDDLR